METAQTADYALLVLLELERRDGQTASEISHGLGVSRNVAQRVLVTLRSRAMVVRNDDGAYLLGPKLIALGRNVPHALAFVARAILRDLSDLVGETVVLAARSGDEAEVVAAHAGVAGPLRIDYETGFRHPLATGASGIAILAYSEPEVGSRLLPSNDQRLGAVRSRGYASTSGEIRADMAGLAVPIFSAEHLVGSLAIISPLNRSARALDSLPGLLAAAEQIGRALAVENSEFSAPLQEGMAER